MNYELSKELEENGFPFVRLNKFDLLLPTILIDKDDKYFNSFELPLNEPLEQYGVIPTLSELIEACGEGFISLSRIDFINSEKLQTDKKVVKYHRFNASGGKVHELTNKNKTYEHVVLGQTPEEAVSRLWLSLNKK